MKSIYLELIYKESPYYTYLDKVEYGPISNYKFFYNKEYHSLSYFDLLSAKKYYGETSYLTSELIIALVEYNNSLLWDDVDLHELRLRAGYIESRGVWKGDALWFEVETHLPKFGINGNTHSGIIQAKASSYFLRVYKETGVDKYLNWAYASLLPCTLDFSQGGLHISTNKIKSWVEEYKTTSPSMVLNGYIFVLIAYSEYLSIENDLDIEKHFKDGLETMLAWFPYFQQENNLLYSLYNWEISNIHYMGVSLYQFEHLYMCTHLKEVEEIVGHLVKCTDVKLFNRLFN